MDLAAIGITWDGGIVRQTDRLPLYAEAIAGLTAAGLTYECFCTRREIREARPRRTPRRGPTRAPAGTCRGRTRGKRAVRPAAVRLRSAVTTATVQDVLHGSYTGVVDDFVLRRNDA